MPPHKDYSKSKIYIIQVLGKSEYYIGSTTSSLAKRIAWHRDSYKQNIKNQCMVKLLFDKYGLENCKIKLYEEYPCDSE